jgi:hypothetical protein
MDEARVKKLQLEIAELEQGLADKKRRLEEALSTVARSGPPPQSSLPNPDPQIVNNHSSPEDKIALFRSLFRGREDIYAKRFESKKTGKSGYQPCCRNEWARGLCEKPQKNCGSCSNRDFEPVTDRVIRNHLAGSTPATYGGRLENADKPNAQSSITSQYAGSSLRQRFTKYPFMFFESI